MIGCLYTLYYIYLLNRYFNYFSNSYISLSLLYIDSLNRSSNYFSNSDILMWTKFIKIEYDLNRVETESYLGENRKNGLYLNRRNENLSNKPWVPVLCLCNSTFENLSSKSHHLHL